MKLELIPAGVDAICGVRVILNVAVMPEEVMLMAAGMSFIAATVVHSHLFVELTSRVNAFVGECDTFDLKDATLEKISRGTQSEETYDTACEFSLRWRILLEHVWCDDFEEI